MLDRFVGTEARRTFNDKLLSGFFDKYMTGKGIDIGGSGYESNILPILSTAEIIDLNYPNYNGKDLPFQTESLDYVFSSHCLEHILDYKYTLKEWFRVIKINGHMIISVPHQFLYEKKALLPSRYNKDHKRFYTPASLLMEIERSLIPNTYRIRLLEDGDKNFDYSIGPDKHSNGQYEILLVLQKIKSPAWEIK